MDRREALKKLTFIGAALSAPALFVQACTGGDKAEKKKLSCVPTDPAAKSLKYVERSPYLDKNCANCALYQAPQSPNTCGGCQIIKGSIHPMGYCTSWVQNPAVKAG